MRPRPDPWEREPEVTEVPITDDAEPPHGTADMVPPPGGPEEVDPFYEAARSAEDRYLRLLADFENFRRRAHKEREAAAVGAVESVARPLLDVLDNLERALAHAGNSPSPLRDGVALTVRQFQEALRQAGVHAVEPRPGEPFDPLYHEAITTRPSEEVPPDSVLTVVSRGYRYDDRVLRPAKVIVSTGMEGQGAS
jgi:molecular chaperone GrpE